MALGTITASLTVDLDDSGAFATELAGSNNFWLRDVGFELLGRGRDQEHDAAGMASFTLTLDNDDGRFSPKNTGGAYYPNWTAYKGAKVTLTFNSVVYPIIKGIITDIKINPDVGEALCEITIRDYMFVLSRTDIRRPLMRDQYTGVIIDRLLDDVEGAESREIITNTHFETDLTGYAAIGGAPLPERVTTGNILEGPAAMRQPVTGINQGWRYDLTALTSNGQKVQGAHYIVAGDSDAIGKGVRLRFPSGAVEDVVLTDTYQRVTETETLGASRFMEATSLTAATYSWRTGATHLVPFINAFPRSTAPGQSQLKQFSYHRGPALPAIQEVRENELGGLFYFNGSGTAVFEDRTHRWHTAPSITSQSSFDERGNLDYSESADDRIKEVVLDYPHWVDGEPGTVVWESDRVVQLLPGVPIPVEADYGGALVRDTITPVSGTDFTINAAGDGSGASMLGSVTFAFLDFGAGSQGSFTNNVSFILYLRTYRVRGTPVRAASDKSPARFTALSGPALASTLTHDYQFADGVAVQAWAEYLGHRYSVQKYRLAVRHSAAFPKPDITSSDIVPILVRQVSDRVTYTNNNLPFSLKLTNADHYIDSIDLRCNGDSIEAGWRLSPVDSDYWRLEEPNHTLGSFTVIAP